MKSASELERELCEECPIYGQTGCDHCYEDALQYVIAMLEQEPTTKNDLVVDAVSRQAINGYINYILSHGMGKKKSFDFIKKFVTNLPSITPQEPKWISVSERLPEDGTWNLFTDGKNESVERYKSDAIDHFNPNGRWFSLEEAVAWMPLPEPYKAESEG
jgi:hypothetical protein